MKRKSAICATMLVSAFVANADGARFLSENAGATVDVAADYLLPANWNNEVVGNAAGRDVTFDARATYGFVKLSDDVSVGAFSGFNNLVLFGDRAVTVTANGQTYARIQNARMYADIAVPSGVNMESYDSLSICGDVSVSGYSRYVGNTLFRADLYAKSSDSVRTTPWRTGDLNMSGNYVWYYAPRGSGAVSGTWSQTDGSPYLFPVDATDAISVGTTVSGDGIRPGSFLKRIFPDGSIELSMPVTTTVSANTVTFAAFNPDFTQVHAAWRCIGPGKIGLVKYREQDSARLVFSGYAGSSTVMRGITMPDNTSACFPGTVVLSNACNLTASLTAGLWLGRCRVELPGTELAGGAGLPNVPSVFQLDAAAESALVVPAGVSAVVNNFTNLVGTVLKEGTGSLTLNLENELDRNTGTLSVREGVLAVSSSKGETYVKSVVLASGAVLKVDADVLRCDTFSYASGAVVDGPGKVLVKGMLQPLDGLSLKNGATVEFMCASRDDFLYDLPDAKVAGDPALWLDVSSGIETDASGEHVLRWNDVRGEGHMFVTNRNTALKPQLVKNAGGEAVSVFLPINESSANADDQAILMWSTPLSNIRAVFIVKGAYMGGGQLLGGIDDMTWMRQSTTKFSYPLFSTTFSALTDGRFYVNGERRSVDNGYAYPGGVTNETSLADWCPQLAEFMTAGDTYADNFAYNRGSVGRSGRQLIHAAIIYTNELTEAQRMATERYLLKRYRLVEVEAVNLESLPSNVGSLALDDDDAKLPIAGGGAVVMDSVSGVGTLEKSGGGLAFVKDFVAPDVDVVVSGGELVVRSLADDGTDLPGSPALHVDASLASSVTTNSSGAVTMWADVRGESVNSATPVPGCWGTATVIENAVGGRPAVSFGASSSYTTYKNASPALRYDNLEAYAFFNVMSSTGGGGVLLGCCDDMLSKEGGKFYGINRQNISSSYSYAFNGAFRRPTWEIRDYDYALICTGAGATVFRQDCVDKDISSAMPSGSYELIACATPEPINTSGFSQIKRAATGSAGAYSYGGMNLGESIIYTNRLSRGAALQIEAYLNRKWFGAETTGYRPAQAKSLSVAAGASVTLKGSAPFAVESFASCGAVVGSVSVADSGTLTVTVLEDGSVAPLGVTGRLTLAGGGVVRLTGATSKIQAGLWPLADDAVVSGAWTVENADGTVPRRNSTLRLEGGRLSLFVRSNGMSMIFR